MEEKSDATEEKSDATEEKSEATEDKSDSKDEKSDATNETEAHTEDKADEGAPEGAPEEAHSDQTPPEGQQVIFPFSLCSEGFTCAKHTKHKPTSPPGVPQGDWLQSVLWMCFLWYQDDTKSG